MPRGGLQFAVQGGFFLEDQRSKFGTLVELKRPLKLERWISGVSFQVSKHFMVPVLYMLLDFALNERACACVSYGVRQVVTPSVLAFYRFAVSFVFCFPFSQCVSSVCIPVH